MFTIYTGEIDLASVDHLCLLIYYFSDIPEINLGTNQLE